MRVFTVSSTGAEGIVMLKAGIAEEPVREGSRPQAPARAGTVRCARRDLADESDNAAGSMRTISAAHFIRLSQLLGSTSIAATVLCLSASFSPASAACGTNGPGTFTGQQSCQPAAGANANFTLIGPSTITVGPAGALSDGVHVEASGGGSATATINGGTGPNTIINNNPAAPNSLGINVVVGSGGGSASVTMTGTNTITTTNGGAVLANNRGSGNSTVTITGTIDATANAISPNTFNQDGVEATTQGGGNATVDMSGATGTIRVNGGNGILIDSLAAGGGITGMVGSGITVLVNNTPFGPSGSQNSGIFVNTLGTGTINLNTAATINTVGPIADGIRAVAVIGSVTIANSGPITTNGTSGNGIDARTTNVNNAGSAMTITNSGSIQTSGDTSNGIVASKSTTGSGATGAISIASSGSIATIGTQSIGILATTSSTSTGATGDISIVSQGPVTTSGAASDGIRANSAVGNVAITNSGPIATVGATSNGIDAFTTNVNTAGGALTITNTGSVQTSGDMSNGIVASKATTGSGASGDISIANSGSITTAGAQSAGILATTSSTSAGAGGNISISNDAAVTTSGPNSDGLRAVASGTVVGNATVTTSANVTASGNFSAGISAFGNATNIIVGAGASVMGGWQADVTSVGINGAPAAGIVFGSSGGGSTLINDGTIGALSDRAVFGDALIINNGTITGFLQLTGVNDVINNAIFDLRHFADTNGDGIRDTLRVAVSDLGSGPSTLTNNGTLALPGSPGASTLVSTGQYLPLGQTFNSMALGGPVQGQILGATTFTNSGTIDLQANPVAGDVLLISGGHTPGTTGGGTFIASGGRLLLDTVLNEGVPNSQSDVLVVDGTAVGPGGATRIFARNAGGAGALTPGDGILVVQSVDPTRSVPGVFALGAPAVAGPYEYSLFLGGVGADATNGNWYLRSTINCALDPNLPQCAVPPPPPPPPPPTPPPEPPGPPPTPEIPNFRIETSLYAAIPSMTLLYGRDLIDSRAERFGDEYDPGAAPAQAPAAPGVYYKAPPSGYYKAPPVPLYPTPQYVGWGRIIGVNGTQHGDTFGVLSGGTGGPRFDYEFLGLQAGMDFLRWDRPDGSRDHAGAYFAIGGNRGDVTHFDNRTGNSDFAAYTIGGYWTHFGPNGGYLDAILQGTYYDISSTAHRDLPTFTTAAQGGAASLEGGYPFRFAGGWFIEPQAQVIYQNIHINDASDIGAQIHFSDVDSLAARIGTRFGRTWTMDDVNTITAWIRPNLWNEFRGNPITSFSSETGFVPFYADLGGLWGEVNVGVSARVLLNTTLFANASYQSRFDGGGFAYTGKAGVRVNW
jgi:autotransporter family porin